MKIMEIVWKEKESWFRVSSLAVTKDFKTLLHHHKFFPVARDSNGEEFFFGLGQMVEEK